MTWSLVRSHDACGKNKVEFVEEEGYTTIIIQSMAGMFYTPRVRKFGGDNRGGDFGRAAGLIESPNKDVRPVQAVQDHVLFSPDATVGSLVGSERTPRQKLGPSCRKGLSTLVSSFRYLRYFQGRNNKTQYEEPLAGITT
jgi:hypothetical protein